MNREKRPLDLENLFAEAVAAHQSNQLQKAAEIYCKILDCIPESPLVNFNYGLLLFEAGEFDQACIYYRQALRHSDNNPDVLYNLALSLQKGGNFSEAEQTYVKILQTHPNDVDALYNLACLHKDQGDFDEAIRIYRKVLKIDSKHASSLNNIAFLYHQEEHYDLAKEHYQKLLNAIPDHPSASYMLQSLGDSAPDNAPPEYVKEVFDAFATNYDTSLMNYLNYRVPEELRKHYDSIFYPGSRDRIALDLGCGTGLAGEAFADICEHLDGVDLSPKMVSAAYQKNIYTHLHTAELLEFLKNTELQYNLFLAADVFTYIGDLSGIFTRLHELASPAGRFCFSTEMYESDRQNFVLRKTGRYAHSVRYIEELCRSSGWNLVKTIGMNLRKERQQWIAGQLYYLARS